MLEIKSNFGAGGKKWALGEITEGLEKLSFQVGGDQ